MALVDADIVAYRCAASCEKKGIVAESLEVALFRIDDLMTRILHETQASSYNAYLTGSDNFRYSVNPEYKANRKDTPRPVYLQDAREFLVTHWKAKVEDGQEADDAMGIYQTANEDTIICTIDKDLLMIPGKHYNFVTNTFREQSPLEGIRHFYWQLIMGDRTDNVMGFDGIARQTVPKKLEWAMAELADCQTEKAMFTLVQGMYNDDERMLMNGRCLWIRKQEDEMWAFPNVF
ncbi:MAG: hypothetical protein KGI54_10650 [Pseudomonadota bacterium]|nr:hypothetical protein [Pseudomonadota bacterium]